MLNDGKNPALFFSRMSKIIEIFCSNCGSKLWIDSESGEILKAEKSTKKTSPSLEDLLKKEQEKKEKADERLKQMHSLLETKKKKAAEIFEKSLKNDSGE